jgi:hypothetical protein
MGHNYGMATRKTTLMLEDSLIADFKIRAAREGRSLSSMVAEAMRTYDPRGEAKPRPEKWEIMVLGKGDWKAPMPAHDQAALQDYMDEIDELPRLKLTPQKSL